MVDVTALFFSMLPGPMMPQTENTFSEDLPVRRRMQHITSASARTPVSMGNSNLGVPAPDADRGEALLRGVDESDFRDCVVFCALVGFCECALPEPLRR